MRAEAFLRTVGAWEEETTTEKDNEGMICKKCGGEMTFIGEVQTRAHYDCFPCFREESIKQFGEPRREVNGTTTEKEDGK